MPSTRLTTQKVVDLLAEDKVITANLAWRQREHGWRIDASVLTVESKELLKLCGWAGTKGLRKRSLSLLYNSIVISRVCLSPYSKHSNPNGVLVTGLHKHSFDDATEDRNAYIPGDINPGDLNEEFLDFLKECKIRLEASYQPLLMA